MTVAKDNLKLKQKEKIALEKENAENNSDSKKESTKIN